MLARHPRCLRALKIGALVTLVVGTLLGSALGTVLYVTFDGVEDPVDGERVGPAITVFNGFVAAFILEAGDGSVVLIDAGEEPDADPVLDALARNGYDADDVAAILLTHGHYDHRGGVARFPQAKVYAHVEELPLLTGKVRSQGPIPWLSGRHEPLEVTDPIDDGDTFTFGGLRIRAFHVPGHTRGSVAWLVNDTLFLGDSATSVETGELEPSPWVFSDDTRKNRHSLAALAERLDAAGLEADLLVFSHAAPLRGMDPLRRFGARHRRALP